MKWFKRIIIGFLLTPLFGILIIALCNQAVIQFSKGKIYDNVKEIPYKEVGLLLGTSPTTINGWTNIYYTYRIDAAVKLYKAKKISRILISGDGKEKSYDEPKYMRRDLICPQNHIGQERAANLRFGHQCKGNLWLVQFHGDITEIPE